jgi:hypothetical protein
VRSHGLDSLRHYRSVCVRNSLQIVSESSSGTRKRILSRRQDVPMQPSYLGCARQIQAKNVR